MEGPSVRLLKDRLEQFEGLTIVKVEGNTKKINKNRLKNQKIQQIWSHGKQLFFSFNTFSLRIHFMMAGSMTINKPKKNRTPRLGLHLDDGSIIRFYACSVQYWDQERLAYAQLDERFDICSPRFDTTHILNEIKESPQFLTDLLLDQRYFAGVGNIIKNEGLFRARLHPLNKAYQLSKKKLKLLIDKTQQFSIDFYQTKKKGGFLRSLLQIYRKGICPICKGKIKRSYLGKTHRLTYWCSYCQPNKIKT